MLIGKHRKIYEFICFLIFSEFVCKNLGSKTQVFGFSQGPGGFRELREAGRNHFHLSWYLLVPGVTSYGQKTIKEKTRIKTLNCIGYVFLKNLIWTQIWRPGT